MTNPWLGIPSRDYDSHMEDVGQSLILSNLFHQSLKKYNPSSIIVIGASTGNGFEHIDNQVTTEVFAIDLNSDYLQILESKYGTSINGLKTYTCNIEDPLPEIPTSDMVFGALIFEYVDPAKSLNNIVPLIKPDGILVAILQKTSNSQFVSNTKYESLKSLTSIANEVNYDEFNLIAKETGLKLIESESIPVSKGKEFIRMEFARII